MIKKEVMPVQEKTHGYAFIENEQIGKELRELMVEYVRQQV